MKEIILTQGQVALVDDEDFERVNQYTWSAVWCRNTKSYYAVTKIRGDRNKLITTGMHRFILAANDVQVGDHVYHNTLTINARNASLREDNISGFSGVSRHKATNKWIAQITVNGNRKYLGVFEEFNDAVNAKKAANIKYGFSENHGKVNIKAHNKKPVLTRSIHRRKSASTIPGVLLDKARGLWRAYIGVNGKQVQLGRHKTLEEAVKARKLAETKYFAKAGIT